MKYIAVFFLSLVVFAFVAQSANAQVYIPRGQARVQVGAVVGEYFLSLTGYQSPFANIILSTDQGIFMRSTVADSRGYFSLSDVRIRKGFARFCLTAIDFRRLGESVTCISIPPATTSLTQKDIFLPPTVGLYKTTIMSGENAFVFGYSMPNAKVTIHLSNNRTYEVTADGTGYYRVTITDTVQGSYKLFADAHYQGKQSLKPTKFYDLRVLSWWENFVAWLTELFTRFGQGIVSIGLILLAIPLIYLILVLLNKLYPKQFTWMDRFVIHPARFFKKHPTKLHHAWMFGY